MKSGSELVKVMAQTAEAVLEVGMSDEVLKAIPVVDWVVALAKAGKSIHDRITISKIEALLSEPRLRRCLESEKIRSKLIHDEYAQEIGERLILVLEKFSDLKKPVLLGRLFAAYLGDQLDRNAFFMLAHAVDVAYLGDLEYFLSVEGQPVLDDSLAVQRLTNVGLFEMHTSGAIGGGGDFFYQTTPLGHSLYESLRLIE